MLGNSLDPLYIKGGICFFFFIFIKNKKIQRIQEYSIAIANGPKGRRGISSPVVDVNANEPVEKKLITKGVRKKKKSFIAKTLIVSTF